MTSFLLSDLVVGHQSFSLFASQESCLAGAGWAGHWRYHSEGSGALPFAFLGACFAPVLGIQFLALPRNSGLHHLGCVGHHSKNKLQNRLKSGGCHGRCAQQLSPPHLSARLKKTARRSPRRCTRYFPYPGASHLPSLLFRLWEWHGT